MCAKSLQSCPTLCDPVDCSPPDSSVMGFSRQEYWSGFPCPPPGDLPNTGIEPASPAAPALQVDYLPLSYEEAQIIATSNFSRAWCVGKLFSCVGCTEFCFDIFPYTYKNKDKLLPRILSIEVSSAFVVEMMLRTWGMRRQQPFRNVSLGISSKPMFNKEQNSNNKT